jgi:hypothetical protein
LKIVLPRKHDEKLSARFVDQKANDLFASRSHLRAPSRRAASLSAVFNAFFPNPSSALVAENECVLVVAEKLKLHTALEVIDVPLRITSRLAPKEASAPVVAAPNCAPAVVEENGRVVFGFPWLPWAR